MSPNSTLRAALIFLPLLTAGCAGMNSLFDVKPAHNMATKKNPTTQVISLWRPARGTHEGRPTRGFAGQIMFFTDKHESPVVVNGEVRVYLFDDQGLKDKQAIPIRQFDFDAPSWNTYAKLSKIGPAYHIFIPYPRPGSHEANCTISLRLVPDDGGPTIFSDEALVTLDGAKGDNSNIVRTSRPESNSDQESVNQSYEITHESIVPEKIEFVSHPKSRQPAAIQRAVAQRIAAAERELQAKRVNYQKVDSGQAMADEYEFDDAYESHSSRGTIQHRKTRGRSKTRHPLSERALRADDVFENDDGQDIDGEEDEPDEFDAVLRKHSRQPAGRHSLDSDTETINVDMSRLHESRAEPITRLTQRGSSRQNREKHPLDEFSDEETTPAVEDFADFDEIERNDVIPLNR